MNQRELEAVMAHEISHIRNRDVRLMTLAAVLVGVIALMADLLFRISLFGGGRRDNRDGSGNAIALVVGIAALVLAPISAALLQASLSRRREYLADSSGAEITGDPEGLAPRWPSSATTSARSSTSRARPRTSTSSRRCATTSACARAWAASSTPTRRSRIASTASRRPAASTSPIRSRSTQ